MTWTPDTDDQLRALWADGHSTAEIGRRMGISKNAVIGKAHRLHLPSRPSPFSAAYQSTLASHRDQQETAVLALLRQVPRVPQHEIARRRGCSVTTVNHIAFRHGLVRAVWRVKGLPPTEATARKLEVIKRMREGGKTWREIGVVLCVTAAAALCMLQRHAHHFPSAPAPAGAPEAREGD